MSSRYEILFSFVNMLACDVYRMPAHNYFISQVCVHVN